MSDLLKELGGARLTEICKLPPPPYLFDGLMRDRSITSIISDPHGMKSVLMLYMALCLDFQKPLFGRFAPVRTDNMPFFFSVDGPDWDMGRIATKLMIGLGLSKEEREMCTIAGRWTTGARVTDPRFWNPSAPHDSWLWRYHEEHGVTSLFIDTKRAATLTDENNSQQEQANQDHFKSMRDQLGIAVVYSHHTAIAQKDSPRSAIHAGRGSSAQGGAVDFQVNIKRMPRGQGGNRIFFDWAKSRGDFAPDLEFVDVVAEPTDEKDPGGGPLFALKFIPTQLERTDALLSTLQEGPKTRAQMCAALTDAGGESVRGATVEQIYNMVDNWLTKQRRASIVKTDGKGVWSVA